MVFFPAKLPGAGRCPRAAGPRTGQVGGGPQAWPFRAVGRRGLAKSPHPEQKLLRSQLSSVGKHAAVLFTPMCTVTAAILPQQEM